MLFSWDPYKAQSNFKKHKVSFEIAQTVFDDPFHISIPDGRILHEERWITLGRSSVNNMLIVIHTYKVLSDGMEKLRIISARRATKHEVKKYEEGI